jgi:hypothetical protein
MKEPDDKQYQLRLSLVVDIVERLTLNIERLQARVDRLEANELKRQIKEISESKPMRLARGRR